MKNIKMITILYVEDQVIISLALTETIQSFGYRVITANSGEKALDIAENLNHIDLVLMDIDLGCGIDGPETARRILEKRNIPILFLTSHAEEAFVERVRKITRYGYVIKDSGDFVLRSSIEMALELFGAHLQLLQKEEDLQQHQIELIYQNEELKRVQLELEASRTQYINLFEMSPVGYFILDEKKAIIQCNLKAKEQLGLQADDLTRKNIHQYILPQDLDIFYHFYTKLIETGKIQVCEIHLIHANSGSSSVRMEGIVRNTSENKKKCHLVVSRVVEPAPFQSNWKGDLPDEQKKKNAPKRFIIKKRQRPAYFNSNAGY